MDLFLSFDELSPDLKQQYKVLASEAFPPIIRASKIVKTCWNPIEQYFPKYQRFLIRNSKSLMGLISTLPFYWDKPLDQLSDDGWDWLVNKGIQDFENNTKANYLGGLQIIISKPYQGQGFSKRFIAEGKRLMQQNNLKCFAIPIRPTFKHKFPELKMKEYINYKIDNKIYDPWIRTHLQSNASVISICSNSMNVTGDIPFWEKLIKEKITQSGSYNALGALNTIQIDMDANIGEYREENIWIYYD